MKKNHQVSWKSGFVATFIGNGIGRFGYITIIPILIQQNWFSQVEAAQLGVATLLGYLISPILLQWNKLKINNVLFLKIAMVICSLSYIACSFRDFGFYWFYLWRFLSGFSGAILIILAAPTLLPHLPVGQRGKFSGLIFSGVGFGAVLSGLLIPIIEKNFNLSYTWFFLGFISMISCFFTWNKWPVLETREKTKSFIASKFSFLSNKNILLLLSAYTLFSIAYIPHTLFWVDFLVRELNHTLGDGGFSWSLFGVGAVLGPLLTGVLSDLIGFKKSLIISFLLATLAFSVPIFYPYLLVLHFSSFIVGFCTMANASLVSATVLELVSSQYHQKVWGITTLYFALFQALGGQAMSFFINHSDSYIPLFEFSVLCMILAIIFLFLIKQKTKY